MDNLTIVIPFYNGQQYIDGLLSDLPSDIPIIIVDDMSDVPYSTARRDNVTVYRLPTKGYFTGACNHGIERCETDVLILNQDARLEGDEWLTLLDRNRHNYALIGERIKGNHPAFPHGYVHGVFQFMRRDAINAAGLMDSKNYPLWGASALWLWQICRKGFCADPMPIVPGLHHWHTEKVKGQHYGSSIVDLLQHEPENKDLLIRTPPMISVVIPCYNYGRYLPDAVNSLIGGETSLGHMPGQTFQSFEVIIVDDASTDNSVEIAQELVDGWNGVRLIRKQVNRGCAAANNTGVAAALGKYVCILSADDMREPWSLEDLYTAATANPGRVIYDELVEFSKGERGRRWPLADYDFDLLLERNMMHAGIMFPRQAWVDVGGYPEMMNKGREDWAFNVALGERGYCGLKIERSGYLYRREGQNRTLRNNGHDWRQAFQVQMFQRFPHLYRGERPDMCCGGKSVKVQNPMRTRSMKSQSMTSPNMVLLEYRGRNVGTTNYGGPGTLPSGRYYRFGATQRDKVKYVDEQDVVKLLDMREKGVRLFGLYAEPPTPAVLPQQNQPTAPTEPEPTLITEINKRIEPTPNGGNSDNALAQPVSEPVYTPSSGVKIIGGIDPGTLTYREIFALDLGKHVDKAEWERMLTEERAGKNRITVVTLIRDKLNAASA